MTRHLITNDPGAAARTAKNAHAAPGLPSQPHDDLKGRPSMVDTPGSIPHDLNLSLRAEIESETADGALMLRGIPVRFRYSVTDPYAVVLDIATGVDQWVRWIFARDLLTEGLTRDCGEGDVFIAPDSELEWRVWITVSSPTGTAVFAFHRADLESALDMSEALVPSGRESERIDWEREMVLLAGGEAT